jgi:cobyrinic acid a,c-diamide synthase
VVGEAQLGLKRMVRCEDSPQASWASLLDRRAEPLPPRLLIAGTHSGVGKTTITAGLIAAFAERGLVVQGFKVGPDYIDPSFHALASKRPARNLDSFLSGEALIAPLLAHGARGADLALIEGVMGLFDGAGGAGELASSAQIAKLLGAPVVLVVDAQAIARSVAALVHGFNSFDPQLRIAGVILNRVGSERHAQLLREALAPLAIPVLGALGREERLRAPERHLGLVPAGEERRRATERIAASAKVLAGALDLEALGALARSAERRDVRSFCPQLLVGAEGPARDGERVRIALARGPAFSFHYAENLELLEAAGGELADFDPLQDEQLPEASQGLLLAGGFPEVYCAALSENDRLRSQVSALVRSGAPAHAECGGLLYLARELEGRAMCGVIDARAVIDKRLRIGYRRAIAPATNLLCRQGEEVHGHEFHYGRVQDPRGGEQAAWRWSEGDRLGGEGYARANLHASFLHTHWAAYPLLASRVVQAARAHARKVPLSGRERGQR